MKESPYPTADARCLCYCPGMQLLTPDKRQRREDAPLICDQLIVILSIIRSKKRKEEEDGCSRAGEESSHDVPTVR